MVETRKVGKRGAVIIPASMRQRYGIEEGSYVVAEATDQGILIRPAAADLIEMYTPERKAQFLLMNAADAADYAEALAEVRKMGIDPTTIPHDEPSGA